MDERRLGHAQRRRVGAPSNIYDDTVKPPSHDIGEMVKAKGRYREQQIVDIIPNMTHPDEWSDGHGYVLQGGKTGRRTVHVSSEITPLPIRMEGSGRLSNGEVII